MNILLKIFLILAAVYIIVCVFLFFFQEKLIFFPEKLACNYQFGFNQKFEEIKIRTKDEKLLHGLLFKTDSSKGLIFYLHGNAGSVKSWGEVAETYTALNYDVFMVDYRGFGKSEGSITSKDQFYQDIQLAYDEMKTRYSEDKIVVVGYSIGTGAAAKIASTNNPRLLILKAPYYSMTDIMKKVYPIIPTFILKYKFATNEYIRDCKMPVVIFHGDQDEVIYHHSSVRLKELIKKTDTVIILTGQAHNGITDNLQYQTAIQRILAE